MCDCIEEIEKIIKKIENGGLPDIDEILFVNQKAKAIFETLPNVVEVHTPVTICGDIHGQFIDLTELFQICGKIPKTDYLFMGDYVDRGSQSVEVVTYLFALKIRYPNSLTLLRGNHESASTSQYFGFRDEVVSRYGNDHIWQTYTQTFNFLPLAALVSSKILCVHGGLSPGIQTINDIQQIDRFREIPHEGPMCDLMWSDPATIEGFRPSVRDAGYQFGSDITKQWNKANGLDLTCRAHQLVMGGVEYGHSGQIVTVFSAPDYCMRCGNNGGVIELDEKLRRKEIIFETPRSTSPLCEDIPEFYKFH